jgi:hypothetical protein
MRALGVLGVIATWSGCPNPDQKEHLGGGVHQAKNLLCDMARVTVRCVYAKLKNFPLKKFL